MVVEVTVGSLCALTEQFLFSSPAFNAAAPVEQLQMLREGTQFCAILAASSPTLTAWEKALLVGVYQAAIAQLVPFQWLSQGQADTLIRPSNGL